MARHHLARPDGGGAGLGLVVLADDKKLADRFAAEGFTALCADDVDAAVDELLASDLVRGDGVGVLSFAPVDVARDGVDVVVVVEEMDDITWTRTLETLRAKLG